jgi:hypothetical protein
MGLARSRESLYLYFRYQTHLIFFYLGRGSYWKPMRILIEVPKGMSMVTKDACDAAVIAVGT